MEGAGDRGELVIEQIDAAELSPGEFAHRVRRIVDEYAIKTVVIDSLNGYQAAMPQENSLILHIHELLQYLNRQGAATFLTMAQHGLVGHMAAPIDVTYLADSVLLLRYFEAQGNVRRAMSCIKKRTGHHETTIREYRIGEGGLRVEEPLTGFQGVLLGGAGYFGQIGSTHRHCSGRVTHPGESSLRALVLSPTGRDNRLIATMLNEMGVAADICADVSELAVELVRGAGLASSPMKRSRT